jgi:hypothetical protein
MCRPIYTSTRVSEIGCPGARDTCLTAADKYLPQTSVVHRAYTPNDLLLLFIKDLLVMGNQYFWWTSKIRDPGCQGTTTSLLDFRNPEYRPVYLFLYSPTPSPWCVRTFWWPFKSLEKPVKVNIRN